MIGELMFGKTKKVHFIGIGGIGMSGIAEILLNLGFAISGSDIFEGDTTKKLRKHGAEIFIGHHFSNIGDQDVVVTSSAIQEDNPEILAAKSSGIPIIKRGEMLAELMRLKTGIAISGTHGKTTTSSMVGNVLEEANFKPTTVIGGQFFNIESNAKLGESNFLVCEADESDGSFLKLSPTIAVVTNIDFDHLDYYKSLFLMEIAFLEFINSVPFYGMSFLNGDDKSIRKILKNVEKPYRLYGFNNDCSLRVVNLKEEFMHISYDAVYNKTILGPVEMHVFGRHNAMNSLAAIGVGLELGIDFNTIKKGLESFKGVGRRLETIYKTDKILILDDYAHHPTEIRATIGALKRSKRPDQRLIIMFQPHRYTRTRDLYEDIGASFCSADKLYLTSIYPANETEIPGINSELIYNSLIENGMKNKTVFIEDWKEISKHVLTDIRDNDIIVSMGAGNINKSAYAIAEELRKRDSSRNG